MFNNELAQNRPKRRDSTAINAEIIAIAKNGASKTQIMYRGNLSFNQLRQYLTNLVQVNLLEKSLRDGREIYRATPKGIEYVEKEQELTDLLNEDMHKNCLKLYTSSYKATLRK